LTNIPRLPKTHRIREAAAAPRQIFYAARREILERTGKDNLDSQYFCQTPLIDYVRETGVDWDIVLGRPGISPEPHTENAFGLGTLSRPTTPSRLRS
jgi:hypothetical protein